VTDNFVDHGAMAYSDPAPVTYAGAAGSIAIWGLQLPDILALLSTAVAVGGLLMQVYQAWQTSKAIRRNRERQQALLDKADG